MSIFCSCASPVSPAVVGHILSSSLTRISHSLISRAMWSVTAALNCLHSLTPWQSGDRWCVTHIIAAESCSYTHIKAPICYLWGDIRAPSPHPPAGIVSFFLQILGLHKGRHRSTALDVALTVPVCSPSYLNTDEKSPGGSKLQAHFLVLWLAAGTGWTDPSDLCRQALSILVSSLKLKQRAGSLEPSQSMEPRSHS